MNTNTCIEAVQHIRRMRGGAQPHLMRASDGNYYVVKFRNNPQHVRVLANELFATGLAAFLGLPVPEMQIVAVEGSLIEDSPGLRIEIAGHTVPCAPGLHLGSRYVANLERDTVFEYLPESIFSRVVNRQDFVRVLAFDKWVGNCDGRQAVFTQRPDNRGYKATFIDQGYCFNAAEWTFPDLPLHGVYYKNHVYQDVTGWDSFEPLLSRIEDIDYADLWRCAAPIPLEWFEHDGEGLFSLIETLHLRRSSARDLIIAFRHSTRNPFPRWIATNDSSRRPTVSGKKECNSLRWRWRGTAMSKQYFIVEMTDLDAEETRIEVERGINYAVGVFEEGVIKLVDYSYRSPDEARQAWPELGVTVIEGKRVSGNAVMTTTTSLQPDGSVDHQCSKEGTPP